MRLFEQTFKISSRTRVLDVGGSPLIWEFARIQPQLTMLNFPSALHRSASGIELVGGDGRLLPFKDAAFDIVFSNSVIEHVGASTDQRQFAHEVARVGRHYWIQTPNRRFPMEPHVMLPFVHYLSRTLQSAIVNRFTIWQLLVHPTEEERKAYVHHFLKELRLLDAAELQSLFPNATIIGERVLGFPKSLVAVRA